MLKDDFNRVWPTKEATPEKIEEFSETAKKEAVVDLGRIDVSNGPPDFSLKDIKDAFSSGEHLAGPTKSDREYIVDEAGKTILLFLRDKDGAVNEVYSPRGKSELLELLQGLKDKHPIAFNYFNDIYELSDESVTNPVINSQNDTAEEPSSTVLSTEERQKREELEAEARKDRLVAQQEPFKYGWCYSDHKTGKEIRTRFRTTDYLQDEPYASSLKSMLGKLGLPEADVSQFFRGTHHELLFIESHGVVIKIGPTDIEDLIHPAILQPLGWIDDKENNLTAAIYPGVELYKYFKEEERSGLARATAAMSRTGQGTTDLTNENNLGIMRIKNGTPVQVVIDVDNKFNNTTDRGRKYKKEKALSAGSSASSIKSEVVSDVIDQTFNAEDALEDWMEAFEVHQSLRHSYWRAFSKNEEGEEEVDPELMKQFWDECQKATDEPRGAVRVGWSKRINDDGVPIWSRHETVINVMALYTPWTEDKKDRLTKFAKGGELAKRREAIVSILDDYDLLAEQPRKYRDSVPFLLEAASIDHDFAGHLLQKGIDDKNLALGLYQELKPNDGEDKVNSAQVLKAVNSDIKEDPDFWSEISSIGMKVDSLPLVPKKINGYDEIVIKAITDDPWSLSRLPSSNRGTAILMTAISRRPDIYRFCNESEKANPAIFNVALRESPSTFNELPRHIRSDRGVYDRVVADYPGAIIYAGEDIQADQEALADAVELDRYIYSDFPEVLRRNKTAVLAQINHWEADYIAFDRKTLGELVDDPDVCLAFAKTSRADELVHVVSDEILDNREVMATCIEGKFCLFEYASERLRGDKAFALAALKGGVRNYRFIAPKLLTQPKFIREAFAVSPAIINSLSKVALEDHKELFLELILSEDLTTGMLPVYVLEDDEYREEILKARPDWKDDRRINQFSRHSEEKAKNNGMVSAVRDAMREKGELMRDFEFPVFNDHGLHREIREEYDSPYKDIYRNELVHKIDFKIKEEFIGRVREIPLPEFKERKGALADAFGNAAKDNNPVVGKLQIDPDAIAKFVKEAKKLDALDEELDDGSLDAENDGIDPV